MSSELITLTRFTCDRCSSSADLPNVDEDDTEIPEGWTQITCATNPDEVRLFDLCADCSSLFFAFLGA